MTKTLDNLIESIDINLDCLAQDIRKYLRVKSKTEYTQECMLIDEQGGFKIEVKATILKNGKKSN